MTRTLFVKIGVLLLLSLAASAPATPPVDLGERGGSRKAVGPLTDPAPSFPVPSIGRPGYMAPVVDPTFGASILRITNDYGLPTTPISGTWGRDARHKYSKQQPWNSTSTLISVQNRDGGTPATVLLDARTYLPRGGRCSNYPQYDYRWHPSRDHPNEEINVVREGTELMWFDVSRCVKTRSWTLPIVADYGIGSGEGNPSIDGRFVAIANGREIVVVDMDPQPPFPAYPYKRIGPVYTMPPCSLSVGDPNDCQIGNISISPSGRYIDVKYANDTDTTQDVHRIFEVDPATLAIRPHNMDPSSLRCGSFAARPNGWIFPLKHADMALDPYDDNEDVIVGGRSCPGSRIGHVVKVRLRDGKVTALTDPSNEASVVHVSTRNVERPGWAYVSFYKSDGKRFSDEIVAVRLDGSQAVERLAHQHSEFSNCYRCEPHAVPSPDGTKVMFASNWARDCGGDCGSDSQINAYVLSFPSDPVGVLEFLEETLEVRLAAGRIGVDYTLSTAEPVRLDVFDAAGRRVLARDLGRPGPGRYRLELSRATGLRPGVYWVRMRVAERERTAKVVFVG